MKEYSPKGWLTIVPEPACSSVSPWPIQGLFIAKSFPWRITQVQVPRDKMITILYLALIVRVIILSCGTCKQGRCINTFQNAVYPKSRTLRLKMLPHTLLDFSTKIVRPVILGPRQGKLFDIIPKSPVSLSFDEDLL